VTVDDVWRELGIDAGSPRDVVRRAYAQRLKLTHPEDDPEGFTRLRAAYEVALAIVEGRVLDETLVAEAEERQEPEPVEASPVREPADIAEVSPSDPLSAHWARCNDLARGIDEQEPASELRRALDEILAFPMLDNLTVFQRTGAGLAQIVARLSPKSDPLVDPIVDYFGWRNAEFIYDSAPEILFLLNRSRVLAERRSFRESHQAAYELLTSPPPRRADRNSAELALKVRLLHRLAQTREPWALEEFRPDAVAWWARRARSRTPLVLAPLIRALEVAPRLLMLGVVVVVLFVIHLAAGPSGQRSAGVPVSLDAFDQLAANADANPDRPDIWARLCAETAKHRWRDQSMSDCDHAVALQPESTAVLLDRAFLNLKVGQAEPTIADASTVLAIDPHNGRALVARSLALSLKNDLRHSRRDWCRALALSPKVVQEVERAYEFQVAYAFTDCPRTSSSG